jgi:hypothetical protein
MWQPQDIDFDLVAQLSETPVATLRISTPDGNLVVMGELEQSGRTLVVRRFHLQGAAANTLGVAKLRFLADVVMQRMDYDELVIEGAARTSGASPGRRPSPLRFARRSVPASRQE